MNQFTSLGDAMEGVLEQIKKNMEAYHGKKFEDIE